MILLTGSFTDKNRDAVYGKTFLVWEDPTSEMDLPSVKKFTGELAKSNAPEDLVIWTNQAYIIDHIHYAEIWRVQNGVVSTMLDSEMSLYKPLSEYVACDSVFSDKES